MFPPMLLWIAAHAIVVMVAGVQSLLVGCDVPVYQCANVLMCQCTNVLMYQCTNVPMYWCASVPVHQCAGVPLCQCANVPLPRVVCCLWNDDMNDILTVLKDRHWLPLYPFPSRHSICRDIPLLLFSRCVRSLEWLRHITHTFECSSRIYLCTLILQGICNRKQFPPN